MSFKDLTVALDDALFAKIKGSGISKYLKAVKEMNVDFIGFSFVVNCSPGTASI